MINFLRGSRVKIAYKSSLKINWNLIIRVKTTNLWWFIDKTPTWTPRSLYFLNEHAIRMIWSEMGRLASVFFHPLFLLVWFEKYLNHCSKLPKGKGVHTQGLNFVLQIAIFDRKRRTRIMAGLLLPCANLIFTNIFKIIDFDQMSYYNLNIWDNNIKHTFLHKSFFLPFWTLCR